VEEERRDWLPPQPAGPEPELGERPAPPSPQAPAEAYAPPAAAHPPPPGYAPQPGYGYAPPEPDNGAAVAGFVLPIVSGGLLILSAGISSVISLTCAIVGLVYARKGKRRVESGETTKNRGLAQAGFVCSIVALVLSALATIVWVIIVIALATDPDFRDDFEREFDQGNTISVEAHLRGAG
jgi:hypothetical protein